MPSSIPTDTAKYVRSIEASRRDPLGDRSRRHQAAAASIGGASTCPTGCRWCASCRCRTAEARFASQIQGRTYANVFGLVERFITAKLLEVGPGHALGDQHALEALVRFSDEEIKHQELFRRIEAHDRRDHAGRLRVRRRSRRRSRAQCCRTRTWAVLVLTLHIELFVQLHYRAEHRAGRRACRELFKDVFLFHWKDECQHADARRAGTEAPRRHCSTLRSASAAVDDFIAAGSAVDGILQGQARPMPRYFAAHCGRARRGAEAAAIAAPFPQGLPLAVHPVRRRAIPASSRS